MTTPNPSDLLRRHGLAADKRFGQHFLLDLNLTRRIARAGGPLDQGTVVEIGPGPGALTVALLLEGARHVVAVETDRRFAPLLGEIETWADGRLHVVYADALETPIQSLGDAPRRIVANLPYNVGAPLLFQWFDAIAADGADAVASITAMLQDEVVDRVVAAPGGSAYGRLAVAAQSFGRVARVLRAPAAAFTPPPKIASAVFRLDVDGFPEGAADWPSVQAIAAAAFGQRRKTLRNSLKSLDADPAALCAAAGVDAALRPERLPVPAFHALAATLRQRRAGAF